VTDAPLIGFVGLGAIGAPMIEAIADAGHALAVHDVLPQAVEAAVGRGATACSSPVEVANLAELVFVSLPTPDVVRTVALGAGGLSEGTLMRTYVDLSTTGAVVAAEVAVALGALGIDVLDAPVSGGVAGARARTLAVMAAGDEQVFERVRPFLQLFGKNVFHVGATPGQGQTAKLLNNLLSATALAITSEAVTFGITAGLDPAMLLAVFNAGTGRNTATATKFPDQVLNRRFESGFRLELMAKDLELCLGEVRAKGFPMQVGGLVQQLWTNADAQAEAGADHTEIIRFFEQLSGVELPASGPTEGSVE
jgi:3-hydroxyisobutyrate dehydrogenase-like beta-hydroxyacid dehydrogenase